jgi:hypothetical protein
LDTEPHTPRATRRRTLAFLGAVFLHALVYFLLSPPWMGEDEPWHFEYVEHVSRGYRPGSRLPIPPLDATTGRPDQRTILTTAHLQVRQRFHDIPLEVVDRTERDIIASMREHHFWQRVDWAGSEMDIHNFDQVAKNYSAMPQPPVYYLLAGSWLQLFSPNAIDARLWTVRALSLLIYLVTAWAGLVFARALLRDETLALCTAFIVAWFPMHARQAAVVNNDLLANAVTAGTFLFAARILTRGGGRLDPVWMLALCGLGLFTKSTAWGAAIVATLAVLLRGDGLARAGRKSWMLAGIATLAGLAAFFWLRKSPAAPKNVTAMLERIDDGLTWDTLLKTWRTWIGAFNWDSRYFPDAVYVIAALVAFAAVVGSVIYISRSGGADLRRQVLFCLAAVAGQYLLIVLKGVGAGRYMMPMLPAAAVIATIGLVAVWPAEKRTWAASLLALGLVTFDALFLWYGFVPNQYLIWNA